MLLFGGPCRLLVVLERRKARDFARCASSITASAAALSAAMRSAKLGVLLSIFGLMSWLLSSTKPGRCRSGSGIPAPRRQARGQDGKPTRASNEGKGSDAGLDDALRRGIDHEESRAAAAAVPGTHSRTRREEGTTVFRWGASETSARLGGRRICKKEVWFWRTAWAEGNPAGGGLFAVRYPIR